MAKPSAYEQYLLELINRARSNPQAEAKAYGFELNARLAADTISITPKQPLALNELLIDSARNHSEWILEEDSFSHTGENNSQAGDRMIAAGYKFVGNWSWGENLAWIGVNGSMRQNPSNYIEQLHRNLLHSAGHRVNIFTPHYREIGIGTLRGEFSDRGKSYDSIVTSHNYGTSGSHKYLTGVVFDDLVLDDDFYTVGEGLGNITITATRQSDQTTFTTSTYDTGGYQIALDQGTYNVTFAGASLGASVTHTVTVEEQNVKLDLIPATINSTPLSISAPDSLSFTLDHSQYVAKDKLIISEGWLQDLDGSKDIVKIDFWLANQAGEWSDLPDVTQFTNLSSQSQWSSFEYELDLDGYARGEYILWGQAIDRQNHTSNAFVQSFTLEQSWLQYQLNQSNFKAGEQLNLVDGWIKNHDRNTTRLDVWLLDQQTQQWLDLDDIVNFKSFAPAQEWSSFNYSLNLDDYSAGEYQLWARAVDRNNLESNEVLKSFRVSNSAPYNLTIKLDQTIYTVEETLTLKAWVVDDNGSDDLAKVDFYLLKADGSWLDLVDVNQFDSVDDTEFEYSLDLSILETESPGTYKLWAVAYDLWGDTSNQVLETFEIVATNEAVIDDNQGFVSRSELSHSQSTELESSSAIDVFTNDSNWLV